MTPHTGAETYPTLLGSRTYYLVQAVECTAANKKYVGGVYLHEFLIGMLSPPLRRDGCNGSLYQLQQGLLHPLAGNVARDRRVIRLPRNLVDLVDIDNALLSLFGVVVTFLKQFLDYVFNILADIARLGESCRVCHNKRDGEQPRKRLCEQGLTRTRRSDKQDI